VFIVRGVLKGRSDRTDGILEEIVFCYACRSAVHPVETNLMSTYTYTFYIRLPQTRCLVGYHSQDDGLLLYVGGRVYVLPDGLTGSVPGSAKGSSSPASSESLSPGSLLLLQSSADFVTIASCSVRTVSSKGSLVVSVISVRRRCVGSRIGKPEEAEGPDLLVNRVRRVTDEGLVRVDVP
jgi:hypothetical protein